ncbi:hypothetical protein EI545_14605 [Tabrizicola piscis]|uniref:Uncharacterized protein n=1 Tax=Tabrizicola piscis TaxID=2494374 RepID=A0A3S8U8M5_9RHOB|nr:hypothetical protein [Tabrizicola piscis]AZL59954.1 hypothetical protein EI545_14605 [Tabrizicola piscis]
MFNLSTSTSVFRKGFYLRSNEASGEISIFILDETYDGDEDTWEEHSARYREGLENEFGVPFVAENVGPGADIPAFLTTIATVSVPLWSVVIATFFLGKPLNENLAAWIEIGKRIKSFFGRPVLLARHGASVVAVEVVFSEMGGLPKSIRLLSYRPVHIGDPDDLTKYERSSKILDSAPTVNLGYVRHIFEIEADGQLFRVSVDGKVAKAIRI